MTRSRLRWSRPRCALDSGDAAIYASVLTKSLSEALPPGYVTVERERSMSDRMRGRPGEVSKVAVKLGDQVMTLAVKNGQPVGGDLPRGPRRGAVHGSRSRCSSGPPRWPAP